MELTRRGHKRERWATADNSWRARRRAADSSTSGAPWLWWGTALRYITLFVFGARKFSDRTNGAVTMRWHLLSVLPDRTVVLWRELPFLISHHPRHLMIAGPFSGGRTCWVMTHMTRKPMHMRHSHALSMRTRIIVVRLPRSATTSASDDSSGNGSTNEPHLPLPTLRRSRSSTITRTIPWIIQSIGSET